jgi:hypothetical protein
MRLLVDAADRKLIDSRTGLRKALPDIISFPYWSLGSRSAEALIAIVSLDFFCPDRFLWSKREVLMAEFWSIVKMIAMLSNCASLDNSKDDAER